MSAYATLPLVSIKILDDNDNGATVKICKDSNAHWAKIYILLKRNLNLPISPDQQDLLGPFRACFKSVLGPDFGPKSPESYLLSKNRTFPDRTQSGLHP